MQELLSSVLFAASEMIQFPEKVSLTRGNVGVNGSRRAETWRSLRITSTHRCMSPDTCGRCGRGKATARCSKCKQAKYCDKACQAKDWPQHKRVCVLAPLTPSAAPTNSLPVKELSGTKLTRVSHPAPVASQFPPNLRNFTYQASHDGEDSNLLLLLHGLGDNHKPFVKFGHKLALPQTATLALSGPLPVAFTEGGCGWFEAFDTEGNLLQPFASPPKRQESLKQSVEQMAQLVDALVTHCGWAYERIHLFGFSQGGTMALHLAMQICQLAHRHLGSVVSIAGPLLEEYLASDVAPRVPLCPQIGVSYLLTHGTKDTQVPRVLMDRSLRVLEAQHPKGAVHLAAFAKGHEMVTGEAESRRLMEFWAAHLHRRLVAMEGNANVYEIH